MKKFEIVVTTIVLIILYIWLSYYKHTNSPEMLWFNKEEKTETIDERFEIIEENTEIVDWNISTPEIEVKDDMVEYTLMDVPNIDSSFKTWMSYKAVTSVSSQQYKYINDYGWADENGFMRSSADMSYGIEQDYYLIALGSYYGTEIGTKYRITLDTGNVFYGVLADCKDDKHTEATNRYIVENGNVVEFLVNVSTLNKTVKVTGSANYMEPLKGSVAKIEKIKFI